MPLQTTGPISLSDVNTELGLSATATISLNDAAVRSLAGIASGPISLNDLYGKSAVSYWASNEDTQTSSPFRLSGVDSSGNVYVVDSISLFKFNSAGVVQWCYQFTGPSISSAYTDSNGDTVIAGSHFNSNSFAFVAEVNSSGTLSWQRTLNGSQQDYFFASIIAPNGEVYVAGYTNSQSAGNYDILLAKYSTSGTLAWQRTIGGSNLDLGICLETTADSSRVYVAGYEASQTAGGNDAFIAAYSSAGTLAWQRSFGTVNFDEIRGMVRDSAGDLVICGTYNSIGYVGKLTGVTGSTPSISWFRTFPTANIGAARAVSVGTDGHIYVSTGVAGGVASSGLLKVSSTGSLVWARSIASSAGGANTSNCDGVDARRGYIVVSYWSGMDLGSYGVTPDASMILKLPYDGTKTGNYAVGSQNMVYADFSLSLTTVSPTFTTRTLTSATRTLTNATSTFTFASASTTSSTATL